MKKLVLAFFCLLSILFSSCEKKLLNISYYGVDFQKTNEVLYLNEDCEHFLIYTQVDDSVNGIDNNIYHAVYCKWSTCKEEFHYEPHTLRLVDDFGSSRALYQENGYMYHTVSLFCVLCGAAVTFQLLCQAQDASCMEATICWDKIPWEEFLCDMPYEISYD